MPLYKKWLELTRPAERFSQIERVDVVVATSAETTGVYTSCLQQTKEGASNAGFHTRTFR